MPEWALNRPDVLTGDEFYIRAFWELSTTRSVGFNVGPIPWNHVVDYASRAGLSPGMIALTVRVIRSLDHAYLKWIKDDGERKRKMKERDRDG